MVDDALEAGLEAVLPALSRLGAVVKFDLGAAGSAVLDTHGAPAVLVEEDDTVPDCTIRISRENLLALIDGRLDPMTGYALGKIRVTGSLGIAMKLVGALR